MQRVLLIGLLIIIPILSIVMTLGVLSETIPPVAALVAAFVSFVLVYIAFLGLAKVPSKNIPTAATKDSKTDDPAALDWLNSLKDKSK